MYSLEKKEQTKKYINSFGSFFGHNRLEAIYESGKFVLEQKVDDAYIYDTSGKRFLDFFLATGVFNLGHRNSKIISVLEQGLATADIGGVFYLSEEKGKLAKKLVETTPKNLQIALPATTGGEANDLAMKLAMGATGRTEFICLEGAYHGSAGLTCDLGPEALRSWFPADFVKVHRVPPGDLKAIEDILKTKKVAACIFEPIRSLVDGKKSDKHYWAGLRELCDLYGSKLIIDEVVCGMGRLGSLWGSNVIDIVPDMLVSAKGLSGGLYPISAVVIKENILDSWGENPFRAYSTYGWSNLGTRVALAAIEETERILPVANKMGDKLESALLGLQEKFAKYITKVQRTGLHFVLDTDHTYINGKDLTLKMFEKGVLFQASGAYPDAPAKLFPPLTFNENHIDELIEKLSEVFSAI